MAEKPLPSLANTMRPEDMQRLIRANPILGSVLMNPRSRASSLGDPSALLPSAPSSRRGSNASVNTSYVPSANENLYNVFNESKPLGKRVKALYNKRVALKAKPINKKVEADIIAIGKKIHDTLDMIAIVFYDLALKEGSTLNTMIKSKLKDILTVESKNGRKPIVYNIANRQGVTADYLADTIIGRRDKPGLLKNSLDAMVAIISYNLTMREVPALKDYLCAGDESFQPDKFRNMVLNILVKITELLSYAPYFYTSASEEQLDSLIVQGYNKISSLLGWEPSHMQSLRQRLSQGIRQKIKTTIEKQLPPGMTDLIIEMSEGLKESFDELKDNITQIQVLYGEKVWTPGKEGEVAESVKDITVTADALLSDKPAEVADNIVESAEKTGEDLQSTLKYAAIGLGVASTVVIAPILGIFSLAGAGTAAVTGGVTTALGLFMGGKYTRKQKHKRSNRKSTRKH